MKSNDNMGIEFDYNEMNEFQLHNTALEQSPEFQKIVRLIRRSILYSPWNVLGKQCMIWLSTVMTKDMNMT